MLDEVLPGLPDHSRTGPENVHATIARNMLADGLPLVLELGASRGLRLVDALSGMPYLDMFSFFASAPLGLNPPALTEDPRFMERLARAAVNKPSNPDVYTTEYADFVATFARVLGDPALPHLFFIDGGALAVENALKAAFDWKARRTARRGKPRRVNFRVLHLDHAFHGRSGYTMSLTNTDPAKTDLYPRFDWPRIPVPAMGFPYAEHEARTRAAEERALAAAREAFEAADDDIACFIAEPVQGEGGDNHLSPRFLKGMQELCREYDALFVLDEVQTGCGTTGTAWAYQQLGLEPDIVAFGKKTQVCGFMAGRRLDEVEGHVFQVPSRISSTWGGNLADMVRATRILEVIQAESVFGNAAATGAHLLSRLTRAAQEAPGTLSNARGRGLMCAVDLPSAEVRDAVVRRMYDQARVIVLPTGERGLRFRPPLVATAEEADEAVDALARCLPSSPPGPRRDRTWPRRPVGTATNGVEMADTGISSSTLPTALEAIGNTPLVPLKRLTAGLRATVLVKLEYFNPTGSYKDRMALAMIEEAEKRGEIEPGRTTIVEYTGGSTGSSLGFVCAIKGYRLRIVTSDAFSEEKIRTITSLGAEVVIEPSVGGKITPDLMPRIIERTRRLAQEGDTYWTDQFNNPDNAVGQRTMGREILAQTGGRLDAFVASVGTAGCAMGVAHVLKEHDPAIHVALVEPATSAVVSGGDPGTHGIEGIALGFVPPLLKKELYDSVLVVDEEEARATARRLALEEGVFAGTSTGANVLAALDWAREHGGDPVVVVPAVDTGLKYISTDLYPSTL